MTGGVALCLRKHPLHIVAPRPQKFPVLRRLHRLRVFQRLDDDERVGRQHADSVKAGNHRERDEAVLVHLGTQKNILAEVLHTKVVLDLLLHRQPDGLLSVGVHRRWDAAKRGGGIVHRLRVGASGWVIHRSGGNVGHAAAALIAAAEGAMPSSSPTSSATPATSPATLGPGLPVVTPLAVGGTATPATATRTPARAAATAAALPMGPATTVAAALEAVGLNGLGLGRGASGGGGTGAKRGVAPTPVTLRHVRHGGRLVALSTFDALARDRWGTSRLRVRYRSLALLLWLRLSIAQRWPCWLAVNISQRGLSLSIGVGDGLIPRRLCGLC
mmetsp:Transcript_3016/g.5454  ORF Transcript_3016/g.5454 Transcript_3016/m.5454 type:complete len:330 (-) Transcript_3016:856-1845(-)